MKKIEKLKLAKLSKNELEARQMSALKGGYEADIRGVCDRDTLCNCGEVSPAKANSTETIKAA